VALSRDITHRRGGLDPDYVDRKNRESPAIHNLNPWLLLHNQIQIMNHLRVTIGILDCFTI